MMHARSRSAVLCRKSGNAAHLVTRQKGVVLFISLIVLVAMTLAGIGLMRSVDTSTIITGNLAFKQSTLQAADQGVEQAYQWLFPNGGTAVLNNDNLPQGFFSASPSSEPNGPLVSRSSTMRAARAGPTRGSRASSPAGARSTSIFSPRASGRASRTDRAATESRDSPGPAA